MSQKTGDLVFANTPGTHLRLADTDIHGTQRGQLGGMVHNPTVLRIVFQGEELDFRMPALVKRWDLKTWHEKSTSEHSTCAVSFISELVEKLDVGDKQNTTI